ncbi:hypothetical protein UFOVP242_160 [uncultured Caudovirales phage]|uniref:Uncharacterized protein n=1 Tax=uncultured Caudovirales phage TaxID=2100421 RepID=A0A6J7WVD9_9CAUD|nr:hypothetical protein UFOVP242_160 [uncultured Caudovirales phage]
MKNEIVVYWSSTFFGYESIEPDYAIKDLHDRINKISDLDTQSTDDVLKCPVASLYLKNTFRVKSPVDYSIYWDPEKATISSNHYDQTFFNKFVNVRDPKSGILSMHFGSYVFFTEEDSLKVEFKAANYADNQLAKNTSIFQGEIDIGRYFRFSDYACFINRPNELLNVKRGDSLYYVRFLTDKKIKLKKFNFTPEINYLTEPVLSTKHRTKSRIQNVNVWNKLENYYEVFKTSKVKKHLIKEIKKNILE